MASSAWWDWVANRAAPAHLLVVEDNETTSRTLRLFLEAQGYSVTCTASGSAALALLDAQPFDLVLLDLMLPDVDGISVCRTLRRTSAVPVVMLTARVGEDDVVAGLDAGADDYVCKPFGSRVLLARIHASLRRAPTAAASSPIRRHAGVEIDRDARSVRIDGDIVRLTRTEFAILHQLMRQPGRVCTRAHLIREAMSPDFEGADRTVDTHIWSLRKKLGERGAHNLIVAEPGIGYRLNTGDLD